MGLQDPVAIYTAESNMDALRAQQFLEVRGLEAYTTEDHSLVGHTLFGNLPEIHRPQVWVDRKDQLRAVKLIVDYEHSKLARDAQRKRSEQETITAICEECGKPSTFAGSLKGSVQDCPHCGAYMDVGDFEWPDES